MSLPTSSEPKFEIDQNGTCQTNVKDDEPEFIDASFSRLEIKEPVPVYHVLNGDSDSFTHDEPDFVEVFSSREKVEKPLPSFEIVEDDLAKNGHDESEFVEIKSKKLKKLSTILNCIKDQKSPIKSEASKKLPVSANEVSKKPQGSANDVSKIKTDIKPAKKLQPLFQIVYDENHTNEFSDPEFVQPFTSEDKKSKKGQNAVEKKRADRGEGVITLNKPQKKKINQDISTLEELLESVKLDDKTTPPKSIENGLKMDYFSLMKNVKAVQIDSDDESSSNSSTDDDEVVAYKPKRGKPIRLDEGGRVTKLESNVVSLYSMRRFEEIQYAWNSMYHLERSSGWNTLLNLQDGVLMTLRIVKTFFETSQKLNMHSIKINDWNVLSSMFDVLRCVSSARIVYFKSRIASEMLKKSNMDKIITLISSPPVRNEESALVVRNVAVYYEDIVLYSDHILSDSELPLLMNIFKECLHFFNELNYGDETFLKRLDFVLKKIEAKNLKTSLLCYPLDLLSRNEYSPIIKKGAFKNIYHYVNTHFNLFKEDFEHSLREGLQAHLNGTRDRENITVFEGVQLKFSKHTSDLQENGYFIKFDEKHVSQMRQVHWRTSSMFFYGSLLLLSKDNFKTYILAKAGDRKNVERGSGRLPISFIIVPPVMDLQSKYSLAEATNYFDAYCCVMKVLKMMPKYKFPFQKYIVFGENNINPPKYLDPENPYYIFGNKVVVSDFSTYPSPHELNLNPYQLDCLYQAINNEICLIQGPPGTGKTFMCKQIIKVLLENKHMWSHNYNTPIVVICYKNLSLDELLDNLLQDKVKVLRIGSNTKNEELALYYKIGGLEPPKDSFTVKWIFPHLKLLERQVLNELDLIYKRNEMICDNKGLMPLKMFHSVLKEDDLEYLEDNYLQWLFNVKIHDESVLNFKRLSQYELTGKDLLVKHVELKTSVPSERIESQLALNNYLQKMLKALLDFKITMSKDDVENLKKRSPEDIEKLEEKWTWYYAYLEETQKLLNEKAIKLTRKQMDMKGRLLETFNLYDSRKIAQSNIEVIGLTTTASARLNVLLEELKPRILIVEEAAEVIEGHCVAALNQHCQHLILFGDHKQLRPLSKSFELSENCNLNLSLFERLANNGISPAVLKRQYRMRPEISALITPSIYEVLEDDDSVKSFPDVKGMTKNVFFYHHSNLEGQEQGSRSTHNSYEVHYALNLALYLVNRGHDPKSITIIAMYGEQEKMMAKERNALKASYPEIEKVIIATVDSYQGKQNNIVILSLVRNNLRGQVGFLKTPNRVCVALSRARHGLYMFGNLDILARQSNMWKQVKDELIKQKVVVQHFSIYCHKHGNKTRIDSYNKLKMYSKGGCHQMCEEKLPCGHECTFVCHGRDLEHKNPQEFACVKICMKELDCEKGHICLARCHENSVPHVCSICPPPPKDSSDSEDSSANETSEDEELHPDFFTVKKFQKNSMIKSRLMKPSNVPSRPGPFKKFSKGGKYPKKPWKKDG